MYVSLIPGYKPCDPQVIHDRVAHMDFCYRELTQLASARRGCLEESRRLWRFFWEMAEEEGWIREKEQILSSDDCGRDLTAVLRLLSQHGAFEDELTGRTGRLQQTIHQGKELVAAKHFGADKIARRNADVLEQWAELERLSVARKVRLKEVYALHQFQADASDADAWMLGAMRVVSSADVGHDEFSARALVKKHQDITQEIDGYRVVLDALHQQVEALAGGQARLTDTDARLAGLEERYRGVLALCQIRRQALQDALAFFQMLNEVDACQLWIHEKEQWLEGIRIPERLDDLEVIQHRWAPSSQMLT